MMAVSTVSPRNRSSFESETSMEASEEVETQLVALVNIPDEGQSPSPSEEISEETMEPDSADTSNQDLSAADNSIASTSQLNTEPVAGFIFTQDENGESVAQFANEEEIQAHYRTDENNINNDENNRHQLNNDVGLEVEVPLRNDDEGSLSDEDPDFSHLTNHFENPPSFSSSSSSLDSSSSSEEENIVIKKIEIDWSLKPRLIPEIVNQNVHTQYKTIIKRQTNHRVKIDFSRNKNIGEEFQLGQVCLKLEGQWTAHYVQDLLTTEIEEFLLYVGEDSEVSIIELKTKKTIAECTCSTRPRPANLPRKDLNRPLIYVQTKFNYFYVKPIEIPLDLFNTRGLGSQQCFRLEFKEFDAETKQMRLNVKLLKKAIIGEHRVEEISCLQSKWMIEVLCYFTETEPLRYWNDENLSVDSRKEDIPWFYGLVKNYHSSEDLPAPSYSLQSDCLVPTLRPYQELAVKWMLFREGAIKSPNSSLDLTELFLNKMFVPIELENEEGKHTVYFNIIAGYVCWTLPTVPPLTSNGGVLADEMGLGKTVMMLDLILLNRMPLSKNYVEISSDEDITEENEKVITSSNSSGNVKIKKRVKRPSPKKYAKVLPYTSEGVKKFQSESDSENSDDSYSGQVKLSNDEETENIETVASLSEASPNKRRSTRKQDTDSDSEKPTPKRRKRANNLPSKPRSSKSIKETSQISGRTRAASSKVAKSLQLEKPKTTYQGAKAVYDAKLLEMSESINRSRPRFHGTFFDTNIAKVATFECICGGYKDDKRQIVTCSKCFSSQHSECVGFNKRVEARLRLMDKEYNCPQCCATDEPFETKGTLIVTPPSISNQWITEIERHVKSRKLKVLFYSGVSNDGYIPPAEIAAYDIVITTYSVLSKELNFVDLPHSNSFDGKNFRNRKRFMTVPSPLPLLKWWRVCLDEAQMVEGSTTKMALMAKRLQSVHRWCMTGTPINHGLEDLYGLYSFLDIKPICLKFWWKHLVEESFYRKNVHGIIDLFGQTLWRTSKEDVLEQLGIPPQIKRDHWLEFSDIEYHFYKQQYEVNSKKIVDKIKRLSQSCPTILNTLLSSLDRSTLHSLMQPFLELRQACCHPQMVKGRSISLQKGTLTMEELLENMIKRASLQCADEHRRYVAALNGMAGIHVLKKEWAEAVEQYREVLQSEAKHKNKFSTDSLQMLHTLENLADLIDRYHNHGIPPTLRDDSLRKESEELKAKYLQKYADSVKNAQEVATPITDKICQISKDFQCPQVLKRSWWLEVLITAVDKDKIDDLLARVKDTLLDHSKRDNIAKRSTHWTDVNGFENFLIENMVKVENLRKEVLDGLKTLQSQDPAKFLQSAVLCHLRQSSVQETRYKCQLCIYHDQFLEYATTLYKERKQTKVVRTGRKWQQHKLLGNITDITEEEKTFALMKEQEDLVESLNQVNLNLLDTDIKETVGDSDTERSLKLLNGFARLNQMSTIVKNDAAAHLKLYESMKKEFLVLRVLWSQIFDQLSAMDELSQATTRLCLRYESEEKDKNKPGPSRGKIPKELKSTLSDQAFKIENINLLSSYELDVKMIEMRGDKDDAADNLNSLVGTLVYLKTLERSDFGKKGAENLDLCPICHSALGTVWNVLCCGHSFCCSCVKTMTTNLNSFLCALCRMPMKPADISLVDTRDDGEDKERVWKDLSHIKKIRGSHSTKVNGILDTLLTIRDTGPEEKVLIFSTWNDVLEIIAKALDQNDISYILLTQPGAKFHQNLDIFKKSEHKQVLLMPLTSGAKGLNIIEATHVFLVEPILSLASELQAIGRVHRIGQTKKTFVHRFFVKKTIEENLHDILQNHDVSSDTEGSLTVEDLQKLMETGEDLLD